MRDQFYLHFDTMPTGTAQQKGVRIIHGKGTGVLRKVIGQHLRTDSRVASHRIGAYGEGDAGVTVVELK